MVEVDQVHFTVHAGQPFGGVSGQGMWDLGEVAAWQLLGTEKGPIKEGDVHAGDEVAQIPVPAIPDVDVGAVEQPPGATAGDERERVAEFVAVGDWRWG